MMNILAAFKLRTVGAEADDKPVANPPAKTGEAASSDVPPASAGVRGQELPLVIRTLLQTKSCCI